MTKLLLAYADRDITRAMKALIGLVERMSYRMRKCKEHVGELHPPRW